MALLRILMNGNSLWPAWLAWAPGKIRPTAAARRENISWLARYPDAGGPPFSQPKFTTARPRMMTRITLPLLLFWAGVALAAPPAPDATRAEPLLPAADGCRFLFAVDTSYSMRGLEEATRQAVFDMVLSGLGGYMKSGDTFGVWTFDEETRNGAFPMQVWDGSNSMASASRVALFLRNQRFVGETQLDELLHKLSSVIRNVGDVTIFVLSDGDAFWRGTAFDSAVNAEYQSQSKARRRAKKPFVTVLVAREGRIPRAFVAIAGTPFELPDRPVYVPPPVRPAPVLTASTPRISNVPPLIITRAKPPEPVKSTPPPEPVVATATATVAFPPTNTPASTLAKAESLPTIQFLTSAKSDSPAPAMKPKGGEAPSIVAVSPERLPSIPSNTVPAMSSPPSSSWLSPPAPLPVAAREPGSNATPTAALVANAPAVLTRPRGRGTNPLLVLGAGLGIISLGLLAVVWRRGRARYQPSLITRSLDQR